MTVLPALERALDESGFEALGAFHPVAEDGCPPLADGSEVGTVVMVGSEGPRFWTRFLEYRPAANATDPMDDWTVETLRPLADGFGAEARFPSDGPPWFPFQRWAARAGPVFPSPLGIFVHATHGLWFGLRAALMLRERLELPPAEAVVSPCDSCRERPCLSACPVGAFDGNGYDTAACRGHLRKQPPVTCWDGGCLARLACPVAERAQPVEQARFHLQAFLDGEPG